MTQPATRKDIGDLLDPDNERTRKQLADVTLHALDATLKGLASGEIRCDYAIHYAATSMGYLLAGCVEQASFAARQAVATYALSGDVPPASATQLLVGLKRLRRLRAKEGS
jgi:hypothetical protein